MQLVPATRRLGFWALTFMGLVILLAVADEFWHLPTGTGFFGRLSLGIVAVFVVLIWLTYRGLIDALSRLEDQIEGKTFGSLSSSIDSLALSGYFMVLFMLRIRH